MEIPRTFHLLFFVRKKKMLTLFDTIPFASMRSQAKKNKAIDRLNERLTLTKGKLPRHGITVDDFREWCYNPEEFKRDRAKLLQQVDSGLINNGQLDQIMQRASLEDIKVRAHEEITGKSFLSASDPLRDNEYVQRKGALMNLPKPSPMGRADINPYNNVSTARRMELAANLTPDSDYQVMFHMQYWLWSLNKVVYKIPEELWGSSDDSVYDIPIDPLLTCPQWSTYIGLSTGQDFSKKPSQEDIDNRLHLAIGAFYSIVKYKGKDYLFINLADRPARATNSHITVQLYWLLDLSKPTIGEALKAADDIELDNVKNRTAKRMLYSDDNDFGFIDIINAIFFINSEYREQRIKNVVPKQHAPRRENNAPYKLNPRAATIEYVVMEEAANLIRSSVTRGGVGSRKAHIRKGHRHGYWVGPRNSDKREYILKWLFPTFVRGTIVDDLHEQAG